MYNGLYGWDDDKSEANVKKHGFDFWVGLQVFADLTFVLVKDSVDRRTGEERWNALGLVGGRVLLTTHVYRKKPNAQNDYTHIISSREANHSEERRYFEQDADPD